MRLGWLRGSAGWNGSTTSMNHGATVFELSSGFESFWSSVSGPWPNCVKDVGCSPWAASAVSTAKAVTGAELALRCRTTGGVGAGTMMTGARVGVVVAVVAVGFNAVIDVPDSEVELAEELLVLPVEVGSVGDEERVELRPTTTG